MRRAQLRHRITHLRRINRRSRPRNNEVVHEHPTDHIGIDLHRIRHRLRFAGRQGSRHRETIAADHRRNQRSISSQTTQCTLVHNLTQIVEERDLTRTVTGVRERERVLDVLTGNNIRTRHRIRRLHHSNLRRDHRMRRAQLRRRITHLRRINRRSRTRNNEVVHEHPTDHIGIDLHRIRHRLRFAGRQGSRHRETIAADHRRNQRSISSQTTQCTLVHNLTQIVEERDLTRTVTGVRERERVLDVLTGNNIRTRHRIRRLHHSNLRRHHRVFGRHRRRSDLRTRRRLRSTGDLVVDQRATGNTGIDLHLVGQNNRLTGFQSTGPGERRTRQARSSTVDTVNSRLQRTVHQRRVVENLR